MIRGDVMKRIVVIALTIILSIMCLVGCSMDSNMDKSDNTNVTFWTDEVTGVQYVIHRDLLNSSGGITPRLNADGSLYIEE